MEVLAPTLVWVGSRCYRVKETVHENTPKSSGNGYVEDDLYSDEEDDDFNIEITDNNRYRCSYHIPQIFFPQIIGSKGATKKRIEAETKTQIRIPKPGVEGDVVIIGPTRKSVSSSRRKINLIVLAARNKHQFTHFLSIPFTNADIKTSFKKFKDDILASSEIIGLDSSLFQNPNKLHLTLVTLSLMDNEDRAQAAQLLHECEETIIRPIINENGAIEVQLCGLEYMNDDPSAVDVLYGKVQSDPLQQIADGISDYFAEKGLTQKKGENVKLHVTLINSLFRDDVNFNNDNNQRRQTFDARFILEKYSNFLFGVQRFTEIHLSQRYSTACDGFYEATPFKIILAF